ncbi:DUF4034 domain-containing protein [Iodobacter fluviatilis]|uniref:DUF4034 domain-containing protein n=1 Tax=Iodobacter fluviatilis TaxID=537 RepID=A0A7G3G4F7_9NEIS|nr:DUF4034 domain-containing protein [Iodobacter fluviatilis]QBC42131.1 hypothetical protein C1H71_00205 [Iodobacter fluviatilis]
MKTTSLKASLVLLLVCYSHAYSATYLKPSALAQQKYEQLLNNKQFDEIDQAAAKAKKNNEMTTEGLPLLAAIYAGTAGCITDKCSNNPSKNYWQKKKKVLLEWQLKKPESGTAKIANALYYLEYGWSIRGTGFSNSVSKERWALFSENTNKAKSELIKISPKYSNDPGWYATMLLIALAQGREAVEFNKLYDEATKKFPLYIPLYFTAASYHSEFWHGSKKEFREFVEQAVKQTQATLGPSLYARLNWLFYSPKMFSNGQIEWPLMRKGLERIVHDYPDMWNFNNFGKFACIAKDAKILPVIMNKIDKSSIISAWGSQEYYDYCLAFAKDVDPDFVDQIKF